MTFLSKLKIGLLAAGGLLLAWQIQQRLRQGNELAAVQAQIQRQNQELESRRAAFAALEQRSDDLVERERRAGNSTLVSLMRERATATMAASTAPSGTHGVDTALANLLDSPEQQEIDRETMRHEMRANLGLFF